MLKMIAIYNAEPSPLLGYLWINASEHGTRDEMI